LAVSGSRAWYSTYPLPNAGTTCEGNRYTYAPVSGLYVSKLIAIYHIPSRGRFQAIANYVSAWDSTARRQGDKKADCILDAVPMLTVL